MCSLTTAYKQQKREILGVTCVCYRTCSLTIECVLLLLQKREILGVTCVWVCACVDFKKRKKIEKREKRKYLPKEGDVFGCVHVLTLKEKKREKKSERDTWSSRVFGCVHVCVCVYI